MEDIIIRRAVREDLDGILYIEKEAFSTPWPKDAMEMELVENALARYLVAEYKDEIIGYAGIWLILNEGHITNVAVKKDKRGFGVGDMLMTGLVYMCDTSDINYITLEVRKSNIIAQNLYKKYGFKIAGERKNYYKDDNEDAIIMNREK